MSQVLSKAGISIVLIQIDEAHSSAWPVGLSNQVEPQATYQDRIERANKFVKDYNPPYKVLIDGWDNTFVNKFRAWPDKGYFVDNNAVVKFRSEYGRSGDQDAKIVQEYTDFMLNFIK